MHGSHWKGGKDKDSMLRNPTNVSSTVETSMQGEIAKSVFGIWMPILFAESARKLQEMRHGFFPLDPGSRDYHM